MSTKRRFLTRLEAASELNVGVHCIDKAIRSRKLSALKVGGRVLIARERFEDFLRLAQWPAPSSEVASRSSGSK